MYVRIAVITYVTVIHTHASLVHVPAHAQTSQEYKSILFQTRSEYGEGRQGTTLNLERPHNTTTAVLRPGTPHGMNQNRHATHALTKTERKQ